MSSHAQERLETMFVDQKIAAGHIVTAVEDRIGQMSAELERYSEGDDGVLFVAERVAALSRNLGIDVLRVGDLPSISTEREELNPGGATPSDKFMFLRTLKIDTVGVIGTIATMESKTSLCVFDKNPIAELEVLDTGFARSSLAYYALQVLIASRSIGHARPVGAEREVLSWYVGCGLAPKINHLIKPFIGVGSYCN